MSSNAVQKSQGNSPLARLAQALNVDQEGLRKTIVKMVFGGQEPSNEEFLVILMVAEKLSINPLLGELWGFKGKNGVIQPIVSIDGWKNIMLRQPNFDGYEINFSDTLVKLPNQAEVPEWAECTIYLKDKSHPVRERVYTLEKYVGTSPVWKSAPRLMLHHRAMIQAIRFAFDNTSGIKDENDVLLMQEQEQHNAASVAAAAATPAVGHAQTPPLPSPKPVLEQERFDRLIETLIQRSIAAGGKWEQAREYVQQRMEPMQANLALTRIAAAEADYLAQTGQAAQA